MNSVCVRQYVTIWRDSAPSQDRCVRARSWFPFQRSSPTPFRLVCFPRIRVFLWVIDIFRVTCRRRHMKCKYCKEFVRERGLITEGDKRKPHCRHHEIGHRSCTYDRIEKRTRRKHIDTKPRTFHFTPGHVWPDSHAQGNAI